MKISRFETFLANAGLRNYLFVRLTTDTGITGLGEASLEWQEKTVETLCHEWLMERVLGRDPFDIEALAGDLIRDQYQGGSTVMTAISGVELALWDIVGKACSQPVYRLLGGRCHARIPAYANGWYGGARTPKEYAERAREAVARGYRAMKFDPLGIAWKEMNRVEMEEAVALVAGVREEVGPDVQLMMEFHGRLDAPTALEMIRRLAKYNPAWCEEPVPPERIELLDFVKRQSAVPISSGERLYTMADFARIISLRAVDVLQPDIAHCGGLSMARRIAALAEQKDIRLSPIAPWDPCPSPPACTSTWRAPPSSSRRRLQSSMSRGETTWCAAGTRSGRESSFSAISRALAWSSMRRQWLPTPTSATHSPACGTGAG